MHYLCTLHDVPEGESRGFEFGPKSVVAVMRDGQLYTYLNWCPHLGIELNFMPTNFSTWIASSLPVPIMAHCSR